MSDASTRGIHAPQGLRAAREALLEWVRSGSDEGRIFLQTHLRAEGGRYAIRHADDRHLPAYRLEQVTDPFRAREIAQTTADGAHRPLKTAPNLRRGWRFEALDESALWTVMDYLYPACVGHWHAGRTGSLRVTHWAETAARQSGMYSSVRLLPDRAFRDAVRACCDGPVCLRKVAWGASEADPEPMDTAAAGSEYESTAESAVVPCPEACSMFVSFARAVLGVERSPRAEAGGLGTLAEAEIEQLRALVRSAAAGGDAGQAREGEFELPLNQRRLRYLAMRLAPARTEAERADEASAASAT